MAVRAACASTNFTTATTWAVVDTSVTSGTAATYLAAETTNTGITSTEASNRAAYTAFGGGFICTIIGKASTSAIFPLVAIAACNASTVVSYVGDATQNFICSWPQVYTASAAPTQDTIDTDTGWLSGDVVALASTTRTAAECEVASLSANAGASTLTYNLYPVNARSGTSPTQAEVILLSRNVRVRSTSATLMTYVNIKAGAVVDIDWAEFYYIGVNATGQTGIDVEINSTSR